MTSSNGNIFRLTGPLCGRFTGHRWIPRTKAGDGELWCFLWSEPKQTFGDLRSHHAHYDAIVMGWLEKPALMSLWWRHKMEHFTCYWPFVRGIHRWTVNSPHKGRWRGALIFSLTYAWTNGWVNNREADDLRRHRAHYIVIVMVGAKCVAWSYSLVGFWDGWKWRWG